MQDYVIDVELFNRFLYDMLAEVPHSDTDYDPRILADRISARLSPTRSGFVKLNKADADRRVELSFQEVEDLDVRERVAHTVMNLLATCADQ